MKPYLTVLSVLMLGIGTPAFAADVQPDTPKNYVETNTVKSVVYVDPTIRVPLTAEQVRQRQMLQTEIEQDIKRTDLNNNREIEFEEYSTGIRRLQKDGKDVYSSFESIDGDKNGKLSSQELLDSRWSAIEKAAMPNAGAPLAIETTTNERIVHHED